MRLLIKLLINALLVFLIANLLTGVSIEGFPYALLAAFVFGIINVTIKPIFKFFSLPFTILSLGFFLLVINALMTMLVAWIVPGFEVIGFWWAFLFALILSVSNMIIEKFAKQERKEVRARKRVEIN